jgi:hypothetical protein
MKAALKGTQQETTETFRRGSRRQPRRSRPRTYLDGGRREPPHSQGCTSSFTVANEGAGDDEPGVVAEQHVEELTLPRARARERRDSRGLGGHRGRGGRRRKSGGRAQRELTRPH